MSIERIMLLLVIVAAAVFAAAFLGGLLVAGPARIIGIPIVLLVGYLAWRVIGERLRNEEDDYYEDRFDK
ncbi:MAG: hypothetical protein AAGE18_03620 [Pseudomonadota bacterium]